MPTPRLEGTIDHLTAFSAFILGDDGQSYFLFNKNLDSFGPRFADLQVSMRVSFIPTASDRLKDRPVALECRVIGGPLEL
jgi:hypothetical protein